MATLFPVRHPGFGLRVLLGLTMAAVATGLVAGPASAGVNGGVEFVPVPAPTFDVEPSAGAVIGRTLVLWGAGAATADLTLAAPTVRLVFTASAQACEGSPALDVRVDGVRVFHREIAGTEAYGVSGTWARGRHTLSFAFGKGQLVSSCDRSVKISSVGMWSGGPSRPYGLVETPAAVRPG